jgi:hypothetical protein
MPWANSGRLTNPVAAQIVLDSGPLSAGTRRLVIVLACSVAATCELQYRNAANDTTLKSQIICVPALGFVSLEIPQGLDNVDNERYRIELVATIAGILSCSVFT